MSEIRIKRSHIAAAKLKQDIAQRRGTQTSSWVVKIAGSKPTRGQDKPQTTREQSLPAGRASRTGKFVTGRSSSGSWSGTARRNV